MRTIWNITGFLAIVNLLAVLGVGGWLAASGRVDRDRIDELRELFARPIAEIDAELAALEVEEAEANAAFIADRRLEEGPAGGESVITGIERIEAARHVAARRLREDRALLAEELASWEQALSEREARLRAQQNAFDERLDEIVGRRVDEQFLRVVKLLETLPAKAVKTRFMGLVAQGDSDQAVRYLDAMKPAVAADVLAQFKTPAEVGVALDLQERLRRLTPEAELAQESPDAVPASDPAAL